MSKLEVKEVIIFKQGITFFILEANVKGQAELELEFKTEQMNDVLKSLMALDNSEKGYISSISYDASIETRKLLESVMLDLPDKDSFSSLIKKQIKGAPVKIMASEEYTGIIIGIETIEKIIDQHKIIEKQLTLLKQDGAITKIPFYEITSLDILNDSIKKDLRFYLDTVITSKKKDVKNIKINCETGGADNVERKIIVSYLHESPVWKINYRIIMSKEQEKENKCLITGFSLIENVTNQDWENVNIILVAGMTVSFVYNAYPAIYIRGLWKKNILNIMQNPSPASPHLRLREELP
ncbi:MAG: hypothetical protein ACTSR8_09000 [Promethearchaeota archaeon]